MQISWMPPKAATDKQRGAMKAILAALDGRDGLRVVNSKGQEMEWTTVEVDVRGNIVIALSEDCDE